MNIFIHNERKDLIKFEKKHQDLNFAEKKMVSDTIEKLDYTKASKHDKVMRDLIKSLQELSISNRLSKNGQKLLRKLQRDQGILRVITSMTFVRF